MKEFLACDIYELITASGLPLVIKSQATYSYIASCVLFWIAAKQWKLKIVKSVLQLILL